MKTLFLLCSFLATLPLSAQSIRNAGILGNSGEQGSSLVRFSDKPAPGMGVVYDRFGTLWDRAGDGRLNRYAPDGRLLASWKIPVRKPANLPDSLLLIDDNTLLFNLERKLFTFDISAAADASPVLLKTEVTHLSLGAYKGWAAAACDGDVFLVNAKGEIRPVAKIEDRLLDIAIGPEGGVYARTVVNDKHRLVRLDAAAPENARGPWMSPGGRPQWLSERWFGHDGHGTIRRFSADFKPDPGVVLGGNSGSFIGYVPGNYDLNNGRGLAHLDGSLYAVSGISGILHLLEWVEHDHRFELVRRIGAVPACAALALDRDGRTWYNGGMWEWSDGPDVPLRHGVPLPASPGVIGAGFLDNGLMVAFAKGTVAYGKLDAPVNRRPVPESPLTKSATVATLALSQKKPVLLVLDKTGRGALYWVNGNGLLKDGADEFALQPTIPFKELTSVVAGEGNRLFAAADGQLVEFTPEGAGWKETRRWNSWGTAPDARFGGRILVTTGGGRIWIADTERQRVLCFDATTRLPVATFGSLDIPGDGLISLNRPTTLAASGGRAVVFDSGNQRLVRLELSVR